MEREVADEVFHPVFAHSISEDVTRWLSPLFHLYKKVGFLILRIFKMILRTSKCAHSIPGKISDRSRWSKNIFENIFKSEFFPKKSNVGISVKNQRGPISLKIRKFERFSRN